MGNLNRLAAKERLLAIAISPRPRRRNKSEWGRVGGQEFINRRRLGHVGTACADRLEQSQKILAGRHWKPVCRYANYVGLAPIRETELDCHAADTVGRRMGVGCVRYAARIGEANDQRRGSTFKKDSRA